MKNNRNKYVLRTCAYALSIAMVFGTLTPLTVRAEQRNLGVEALLGKTPQYIINTNPYMTRLKADYLGKGIFQIAFKERDDKTGDVIFDRNKGTELIDKGEIQVNGGKKWSFRNAGIEFENGRTKSSFKSENTDFIKEFVNSDDINVKIFLNDKQVSLGSIPNNMSQEERENFLKNLEGEEAADKKELNKLIEEALKIDTDKYNKTLVEDFNKKLTNAKNVNAKQDAKQEEVDKAKSELEKAMETMKASNSNPAALVLEEEDTFIKKHYGTPLFRIVFKGVGEGLDTKSPLTPSEKEDFLKNTNIKINNTDLGKMSDLGFTVKRTYVGAAGFELEDFSGLKSVIKADRFNVQLITKDKGNIEFTFENGLSQEDRDEIGGKQDNESPIEKKEEFNSAAVQLVKSGDHKTPSMSGATLKNTAELLKYEDGKTKLVLHFNPAVINGILAYATGLTVEDGSTEFILKDDNSAICIVSYDSISDERVSEGHIWSSVMDADVALKISEIKKVSDVDGKLQEKIAEANRLLDEKEYYEESQKKVRDAVKDAKKSDDKIAAYVNIEKALAGLVEKKADPFVGDTMFHLKAIDTSVAGSKSLYKYVRVTVDQDGGKVLTAKYNSYSDWSGKIYFDDIKVLDKDGAEIPVEYELDDAHNGTLRFKMPEIPASGIFKIVLREGDGRINNSDLKMDYTTIKKGVFRELLQDAIEEYTGYERDDWSGKGNIEEKKADFTASSWSHFEKVLDRCKADLRRNVSQDTIDRDIAALKEARLSLVYKVKAGQGNTANIGTKGFNNPENYYSDGFYEKPVKVGWAGSRIIFGGHTYKVLNNGNVITEKDGERITENTGKIFIMSEDVRVKKVFSDSDPDSFESAVRWDSSILRAYLNDEFYNSFNELEKSVILETELETYDGKDAGFSSIITNKAGSTPIITKDYIFAPDLETLQSPYYGFASNDGRDEGIYYATRMIMQDALGSIIIAGVKPKGRIEGVFRLNSERLETLPCMNLDANKILMTVDRNASFADFKEITKTENNIWKLVILDETISAPKANFDGGKVDIEGSADKVYAAIVSGDDFASGELKYFGKVDGTFTLNEEQKNAGKLYLLSINDEGSTAYASQPVLLKAGENSSTPGTPDDDNNKDKDNQNNDQDKNKKDMQVTAKLEASESDCFVTIPSSITIGELSADNYRSNYRIKVEVAQGSEVLVEAESGGEITSGVNRLTFTNDFGRRTFRSSEEVEANIIFNQEDIRKAKPGDYTGTTTFNITIK